MRGDRARLLAVALALAAPSSATATAGGGGGVRARLELRVNEGGGRDALVLLDGADAWVAADDLSAAGLVGFGGERRAVDGRELVSLRSLGPALTFAVDERRLSLDVTAGPELLARREVDLAPARPAGIVEGGEPSLFVNYSVQAATGAGASGAGEVGASVGRALLTSGLSVPPGGGPVRGLSAAAFEDAPSLLRFTAGDAAVSLGGLGSSGVVGGLGVARDFSLDPYAATAPRPATAAFASTPSTLEVWVNGALVRRQEVAPGTLDLTNLPVNAGANAVRTVLRDAYGREQSLDLRATFSPGLLAPGLSDYACNVGFLRDDFTRSFQYGRPVLLARQRLGITPAVTVGGRFEAGLDRAAAGASAALGTRLGTLDAEVAGSAQGEARGLGAAVGWAWNDRRASAGVRLRTESARYATAVQDREADRRLLDGAAFFTVAATRRVALGIEATGSRWRDAGDSASLTARTDVALAPGLALLLSATAIRGAAGGGVSSQALLSWSLGARTTAQASARAGGDGPGGGVGAQRALPLGAGYGYRIEAASAGREARGAATLQWNGDFARVSADADRAGAGTNASATAAGAVVLAGNRAFLTRPVEGAYALMRVGAPDVRGYLENQEIGRTDARGDLLVPALVPRYGNRLAIRAGDVPLGYEVPRLEVLVGPGAKGAALARFGVEPIRAVTGLVRVDVGGRAEIPTWAQLSLDDGGAQRLAPTTSEGRFFLERVTAGRHEAVLTWRDGTCRLVIEVRDAPGVQDVGTLRCLPLTTALAP